MAAAGDENAGAEAAPESFRSRPLLHYEELALGTQIKRAKFTCIGASDNFLACGTSNGHVCLYATSSNRSDNSANHNTSSGSLSEVKRTTLAKYHLVKMLSPPSSSDRVGVACLSICPLQKRLVVGTMRGVVYGLLLTDYNKIGDRVEFKHDFHTGFPVTCLLWDSPGSRVYSACNGGMLAQTTVRAGVSAFFGSADTELLLKEETGIVQLDMVKYGRADILLVSSQLRVLLLNLSSSDGSVVQIGTKARQGNFGACFVTTTSASESTSAGASVNVKVFSARPGRRVWIADPQTGTVSATLKFPLTKAPVGFLQSPGCAMDENIQPRDLTINKLALYHFLPSPWASTSGGNATADASRSLLVSWNVGTSVLFLLDPLAVEVVEWHLDLGVIHDLKVLHNSMLVVLHGDGPKISIVQTCSARQFIDIYAGDDVEKAVELAIEYAINDAAMLETLQNQWSETLATNKASDAVDQEVGEQRMIKLKSLLAYAKELEEKYQSTAANDADASTPLQVIFKQRPQQQQQQREQTPSPDLFATQATGAKNGTAAATTRVGTSALHTNEEYLDVLTPSVMSYSRSIYAPDGSTLEARMIDIPDVAVSDPIVRSDDRDAWMEDVEAEVRHIQEARAEDSSLNVNQILRGTLHQTGAAAKAITTFIPGANMISNFMDTATNPEFYYGGGGGSGLGAGGIFGDLPDMDAPVLDPIEYKPRKLVHEYAVLRIAMSSTGDGSGGGGGGGGGVDAEVLLEAISMDIWDSKLKYISNLPLEQQISLPDAVQDETGTGADANDESKKPGSVGSRNGDSTVRRATDASILPAGSPSGSSVLFPPKPTSLPIRKSRSVENLTTEKTSLLSDESSSLHYDAETASSTSSASLATATNLYPSPVAHNDRERRRRRSIGSLQHKLGGRSSCDYECKGMVRGLLATMPELDSVLVRQVPELLSDLGAAAATAEKTARLSQRLWPASGITRVCACLANMYLLEGDLNSVSRVIGLWLTCFDPTAKASDSIASSNEVTPVSKGGTPMSSPKAGVPLNKDTLLTRGEALLDGDGLPLTRSDWTMVRVLVTVYFAVCTGGSALTVRPATAMDDRSDGSASTKPYAYEMGVILELTDDAADIDEADDGFIPKVRRWSPAEAEVFVTKYGVYLNTELAAEVCNRRRLSGALNAVLGQVVSSSSMASVCDDVVNWIAEKKFSLAKETIEESGAPLCLLLQVLDLLFKKCAADAIEWCVAAYPLITPWNVERCLFGVLDVDTMRKNEDNESVAEQGTDEDALLQLLKSERPENAPQSATYFHYLVRLLAEKGESAGRSLLLVSRCLHLSFGGDAITSTVFSKENDTHSNGSNCDTRSGWLCRLLQHPERFCYDHQRVWALCDRHHDTAAILELLHQSFMRVDGTIVGEEDPVWTELSVAMDLVLAGREWKLLEELLLRVAHVHIISSTSSNSIPPSNRVVATVLGHMERYLETFQAGNTAQVDNEMEHESKRCDKESPEDSGDDNNEARDAAITTVIHALLHALGAPAGMALLAQFPRLFGASSLALYQTIVETHVLNQRQREEVDHMLEVVDTHVWAAYKEASSSLSAASAAAVTGALTPMPSSFSLLSGVDENGLGNDAGGISFAPQVHALLELERGALRPPLDEISFERWQRKRKQYEHDMGQADALILPSDSEKGGETGGSVNGGSNGGATSDSESDTGVDQGVDRHRSMATAPTALVSRFFEYRSSDWGGDVQLHDATCAVCDLPVVIIAANDNCNLEVALLPCGHAFHAMCVVDTACPTCFAANFELLATEW